MHLTDEEKQALRDGRPVRVQTDGLDCVVLRTDFYEQLIGYEDSDVDPRELYPLVDRVMREDAAGDPALMSY
ncbi:MAG: hypothetical protein ACREJB_12490 [Planctomycetaceae bacterium]